ncbi:MAG: 2-phosphosulfolactate phosphatase [Sphingobacteriales bacterium]|nr:MAG: 2-phosphosulfolactate phosphatase [Sphingobacteriales bacterium]
MPQDNRPRLEVCLSPALLHLFDTSNTIVVIIDVFRATSTIAAALDNGASYVLPVASVEECISLGKTIPGSLTAGERDGKVAAGLEYGNSPLEYPRSFVENRALVLTTTNGTRLLHMVQDADEIITGSFLNLDAVCQFLLAQGKPVLLGCAAWKDRFNLEDTLFAGAVVNKVKEAFSVNCDSARAASILAQQASPDYFRFLKDSSHFRRLSAFGLEKDMEYCTTPDLHPVVPILKGNKLVNYAP